MTQGKAHRFTFVVFLSLIVLGLLTTVVSAQTAKVEGLIKGQHCRKP